MNPDYAGHFPVVHRGTCQKCESIHAFRRRQAKANVEPNGDVYAVPFNTRGMVDDQGRPFRQEVPDGRS